MPVSGSQGIHNSSAWSETKPNAPPAKPVHSDRSIPVGGANARAGSLLDSEQKRADSVAGPQPRKLNKCSVAEGWSGTGGRLFCAGRPAQDASCERPDAFISVPTSENRGPALDTRLASPSSRTSSFRRAARVGGLHPRRVCRLTGYLGVAPRSWGNQLLRRRASTLLQAFRIGEICRLQFEHQGKPRPAHRNGIAPVCPDRRTYRNTMPKPEGFQSVTIMIRNGRGARVDVLTAASTRSVSTEGILNKERATLRLFQCARRMTHRLLMAPERRGVVRVANPYCDRSPI
jgi:hypothetical protein